MRELDQSSSMQGTEPSKALEFKHLPSCHIVGTGYTRLGLSQAQQ